MRNPEDKNPQTITKASFGFRCGTGKSRQFARIRLGRHPLTTRHDPPVGLAGAVAPAQSKSGSYDWRILDAYLDAFIAAHQPRDAMYTFGYTPCWDSKGRCEATWGATYPPSDLTANGSPSFNAFVTALVTHCSRAGNCVSDRIKYWELWNEANAGNYWNGTVSQLYQLMAPAIPIIRSKVSGALILTRHTTKIAATPIGCAVGWSKRIRTDACPTLLFPRLLAGCYSRITLLQFNRWWS